MIFAHKVLNRPFLWISLFFLLFPTIGEAKYREIPANLSQLIEDAENKGILKGKSAVILDRRYVFYPQKNGECLIKKNVVGLVQDQKSASDYGQITFHFNGYLEDATLDYARTYNKDRGPLSVSKDAVQTRTPHFLNSAKTYTDIRELAFSLPGLKPGSIFEYQITIRSKPAIRNGWCDVIGFNEVLMNQVLQRLPRVDAVFKSEVRLVTALSDNLDIKYHLNNASVEPTIKKTGDNVTYTWILDDLKPVVFENNMPAFGEITPSLILSSFDNWDLIENWAFDQFTQSVVQTEEIKSLAGRLSKNLATRKEKIKAVYKYMQSSIEYVMADVGKSGYIPHRADQVLLNGYGDCKDQSVLTTSLLNAMGISAYPALLVPSPDEDVNTNIPSHLFSHVIVYIPDPVEPIWIDTTSNSKFPNLFTANQRRNALVLDAQPGHFKQTPSMISDDNGGKIKIVFRFDDQHLRAEMNISAASTMGDIFKSQLSMLQPEYRKRSISSMVKNLFPKGEVDSVNFSDMKDSDADFNIDVHLSINDPMDDAIERVPFSIGILGLMSFFTDVFTAGSPLNRNYDYNVATGEFNVDAEWVVHPPGQAFLLDLLPFKKEITTDFFDYHVTSKKEGASAWVMAGLKFKQPRISKADYPRFYDNVQNVIRFGTLSFGFNETKIDNETIALEGKLTQDPRDIATQLLLSKRYLKTGKYEEALKLLEKSVQLDQTSGEVYYYYGLALGYVDQFEASEKAFNKAKGLGYTP